MIEFNLNDLSQEKVFLLSIHSNGMLRYYTSIKDFRKKKKPKVVYVKKSIFNELIKDRVYSTSSISYTVPRVCYLNKLKSEIVSLDYFKSTRRIFGSSGFSILSTEEYANLMDDFCKKNERIFTVLENKLKDEFGDNKLFTDGDYIFDLNESNINKSDIINESGKFVSINDDASLILGAFKGVSFNFSDGEQPPVKRRYVLAYQVKDENDNNIVVYFPSFSEKITSKEDFQNIETNKFVNLRFMTNFVKKYSSLFDYQDMELLHIEETILELGILTLGQIDDYQYDYYVYSHNFTPIIAWLARLMYKSDTLSQISAVKRVLLPLLRVKETLNTFNVNNVFTTPYEKLSELQGKSETPEKVDISKYLNVEKAPDYKLKLRVLQELDALEMERVNDDIQKYYDDREV